MKKYSKAQKEKYSFQNYKGNKNCKAITYKGQLYVSKMQCKVLNDLDDKDLEEYLNKEVTNEAE